MYQRSVLRRSRIPVPRFEVRQADPVIGNDVGRLPMRGRGRPEEGGDASDEAYRHTHGREDTSAQRQPRPRKAEHADEREDEADDREPHADGVEVIQQMGRGLPTSKGTDLLEMGVRRPDGLGSARCGRPRRVCVCSSGPCPRPIRGRVSRAAGETRLDFALFPFGSRQLIPDEEECGEEGEDGGEDVHDQRARQGGIRELASDRFSRLGTRVGRSGAE